MQIEIIDKLKKYLLVHQINKEDQVVYVMVELRKLLDRLGDKGDGSKYPLIRFYSDWVVHTEKDIITSAMKNVLHQVEERLDPHPKEDDVSFLLLPEFRNEMIALFEKYGFNNSLFESLRWKEYVISLTQVLADQPMIEPTRRIKEFRYITRDKNHLSVSIDFNDGGSITIVLAEDTL